jgi:predicted DNA-binding transcriptional regulator AlpA
VTGGLLTTREVAERLRYSPATLVRWRGRGEGPPWITLDNGRIRYDEDVLEEWIEERATPRRGVLTTTSGAARPRTVPSLVLTTTKDEED